MWKNEKFTLAQKIFREINSLVTSFIETLRCFHEIYFKKVCIFSTLHCVIAQYSFLEKREIHAVQNFFRQIN